MADMLIVKLSYKQDNSARKMADQIATRQFEIPDGINPTRIDLKHPSGEIVGFYVIDTVIDQDGNVTLEVGEYDDPSEFQKVLECGFEATDIFEPKYEGKQVAFGEGGFGAIGH